MSFDQESTIEEVNSDMFLNFVSNFRIFFYSLRRLKMQRALVPLYSGSVMR